MVMVVVRRGNGRGYVQFEDLQAPKIIEPAPEARQRVAAWMMERGYATGHGDTIEDLLVELEGQAKRRKHQDGEATDRPTEA